MSSLLLDAIRAAVRLAALHVLRWAMPQSAPQPLRLVGGETARRLRWEIYDEGRHGVIVKDLDTEHWATGSGDTEAEARANALHNLAERPCGARPRRAFS